MTYLSINKFPFLYNIQELETANPEEEKKEAEAAAAKKARIECTLRMLC